MFFTERIIFFLASVCVCCVRVRVRVRVRMRVHVHVCVLVDAHTAPCLILIMGVIHEWSRLLTTRRLKHVLHT